MHKVVQRAVVPAMVVGWGALVVATILAFVGRQSFLPLAAIAIGTAVLTLLALYLRLYIPYGRIFAAGMLAGQHRKIGPATSERVARIPGTLTLRAVLGHNLSFLGLCMAVGALLALVFAQPAPADTAGPRTVVTATATATVKVRVTHTARPTITNRVRVNVHETHHIDIHPPGPTVTKTKTKLVTPRPTGQPSSEPGGSHGDGEAEQPTHDPDNAHHPRRCGVGAGLLGLLHPACP